MDCSDTLLLPQGSFGEAVLISDPRTKQKFVLKKVKLARMNDWQRRAQQQELELGRILQHPFIVRFCSSWIRDTHEMNVVYAYAEKGDLSSVLKKQGRAGSSKYVEERQLRKWAAQLILALHYIHGKGVVHRDIKPSNIFVTLGMDLQLGDFGLSCVNDPDEGCDQAIVGTPHFMSPEVLGQRKYDAKTDVWSLGCVLFEMSSGKPPFDAFDLAGLCQKVQRSAVPSLPAQAKYSEEWERLLRWMLRKEPSLRPSVDQLLASPALAKDLKWACARAEELSLSSPSWPAHPSPLKLPLHLIPSLESASLLMDKGVPPLTPRREEEGDDIQGGDQGTPVPTRGATTLDFSLTPNLNQGSSTPVLMAKTAGANADQTPEPVKESKARPMSSATQQPQGQARQAAAAPVSARGTKRVATAAVTPPPPSASSRRAPPAATPSSAAASRPPSVRPRLLTPTAASNAKASPQATPPPAPLAKAGHPPASPQIPHYRDAKATPVIPAVASMPKSEASQAQEIESSVAAHPPPPPPAEDERDQEIERKMRSRAIDPDVVKNAPITNPIFMERDQRSASPCLSEENFSVGKKTVATPSPPPTTNTPSARGRLISAGPASSGIGKGRMGMATRAVNRSPSPRPSSPAPPSRPPSSPLIQTAPPSTKQPATVAKAEISPLEAWVQKLSDVTSKQEAKPSSISSVEEKAARLERTLDLCARLHQLGRKEELGSLLSSFTRPQPSPTLTSNPLFQAGDQVTIQGLKGIQATVKWAAPTHWDDQDVIGLELSSGQGGTSDGSVDGIRYFGSSGSMNTLFMNQANANKLVKIK